MSANHPRIWVLLGPRVGDNNQLLALAEGLKLPFETRLLSYNSLHKLSSRLLWPCLSSLDRDSRRRIEFPWPDLVMGIGQRSVPVARWLQRQSGGTVKVVRLGNPRIDPEHFDLVVTTPQYPVPPGPNVITLPLAMSRSYDRLEIEPDEQEYLAGLPRPHLLLALGGRTKYWRMHEGRIVGAARLLLDRARTAGGSLIVVTSQRTEPRIIEAIAGACRQADCCRFVSDRPRYGILLDDADEVYVTADSISMISEAIGSGKPAGMIPIEPAPAAAPWIGFPLAAGGRDLRRFWQSVISKELIGTVEHPVSANVENPVVTAARAVHTLLQKR